MPKKSKNSKKFQKIPKTPKKSQKSQNPYAFFRSNLPLGFLRGNSFVKIFENREKSKSKLLSNVGRELEKKDFLEVNYVIISRKPPRVWRYVIAAFSCQLSLPSNTAPVTFYAV